MRAHKRYIISIDQGTTSSRALLYDFETKKIIKMKQKALRQIYPTPGWVEHDAQEIWQDQLEVLRDVVTESGIALSQIACVGVTNQRETVVVWEKNTGKPIYNAIVWQCRRTANMCDALKSEGWTEKIHRKTGLVVDAYFSGTKIKWILDHIEGARDRAKAGELLVGTIDTWLIWNLTGGKSHVTDYSNASRTMLFNITTLEWDKELLAQLNVPIEILPQVVPSSGLVGEMSAEILGIEIPISGIAGDQQAALFGQACFEAGSAKNTYGTGCFILLNTGKKPVFSKNNLLTTIAWAIGDQVEYALEGSVFNAGSAIQWLRDELGLIENAAQSEVEAKKVPDAGGIYFVPAFTGLGAPYWDMYARGILIGITRGTKKEHIIRATLESIAYQSKDVFEVMRLDSKIHLKHLKVDGGASANSFLMQYQADILGLPVEVPAMIETTALGAIYLSGLGIGLWKTKEEIYKESNLGKTYMPLMNQEGRVAKYAGWKKAVKRSMHWEI